MHKRDARKARLGLEVLEDRTALTTGLSPLPLSAPSEPVLSIAQVPNDPRFSEEWALRNTAAGGVDIKATQAWDVTTGSTKMTVSIMDTGVDYTHPDLYLNIWLNQGEIPASRRKSLIDTDGDGLITFRDLNDKRNQGVGKITDQDGDGRITGADLLRPMGKANGVDNGTGGWADGISNDGDAYIDDLIGWNFVDNNNNPMDKQGHGTHVAGTIGAVGNDGIGIAGINWKIQMMPIRFMDGDGKGTIAQFIAGLEYAVAHGAKVSNNSWIGSGISDALTAAVNDARAKGHILVCAAGNQGENNDVTPNYPASYTQDNVLSVAAIDSTGKLATFSNYGKTTVDLAAPGGNILSTAAGGGYKFNSGTSMATPHVTGVVALVWGLHPAWTYSQVISQVMTTATRTAATDGKMRAGVVDAAAAVGYAKVTATPPVIINANEPSGSTTSLATFRVTFDRAMSPSTFTAVDVVVTGPAGQSIAVSSVTSVAGYGDRVFDIKLSAAQTAAGTYTLRIGPAVHDTSGASMGAVYQRTFTIAAPANPPVIINAVNLGNSTTSINTFRVTFDRAMNASTFTPADVVVTGPSGQVVPVASVVEAPSYGGRVFDITLGSTQTVGGTYTLRIGPAVNDTAGVPMAAVFQRLFAIASPVSPPVIVNANEPSGSTTSLGTIRVTFDRVMSPSTFTAVDVVLTGPSGQSIAVSSVTSVAGYDGRVFDIKLSSAQTAGGTYTLRIGPAINDTAGVPMAAVFQRTFTIAAPVNPPVIVNAVNLGNSTTSINTFRVTFDRVMNASTFTAADVVVLGPTGQVVPVASVVEAPSYGGRVFDINLASTQTAGGTYTLRVGPAVHDTAGVPMASMFQRLFAIAAPVSPPVIVNANEPSGSTTSLGTFRVTFDRVISPSTFTAVDVVVTGPSGQSIAVSSVTSVAGYDGRVFDIKLSSAQTAAGTYTLRIGPAVNDTAGVPMAAVFQRTFTIAAPVNPPVIINAVNLGNSTASIQTFRVTFDRVMTASTFTPVDVAVTGPTGQVVQVASVAAAPSYGGRVFDITLTVLQTMKGTYTLRIGPAVNDTAGVAMAAAFQRTFTLV
jgi:subtilisin family serine protease